MLVLTRRFDEEIWIGDDVVVKIVDIRGDRVRVGITAPTKLAVHRAEVKAEIDASRRRGAKVAGESGKAGGA